MSSDIASPVGGARGRRRPAPPAPPPFELQRSVERDLRRALREDTFTTYRFALVHALADLCRDAGGDTIGTGDRPPVHADGQFSLPLHAISRRVVELYWPQAAPWPSAGGDRVLVQNAGRRGGGRRRAAVVRKVLEARREHGGEVEGLRAKPRDWARLVSSVQRTLRDDAIPELEAWAGTVAGRGRRAAITLRPGVAHRLRSSHARVAGLARDAWVDFIRRTNPDIGDRPGELRRFLFGPAASSPASAPAGAQADAPAGESGSPSPIGKERTERWIREFVNGRAGELASSLARASGGRIRPPIEWMSPIESDGYARYRGPGFLDRIGVTLQERSLESFWPGEAPEWDALGIDAQGAVILVDAKATVPELLSACAVADPTARASIVSALEEVQEHLGVGNGTDWSATFYGLASRLAHLHLLCELNGVDAWLVSLHFTGDGAPGGPDSEEDWLDPLRTMYRSLGLTPLRIPGRMLDVFLDVR